MLSYMIKISVGIAYEQNRPTGAASALRAQFGFWAKSALKCIVQKKFSDKSCYKSQYATSGAKTFLTALLAQFRFLVKSALKMRCTKFSYQIKVVPNQYPQLLCIVTFFDILHHYGVIAASQICSVSRKYCAVLQNRFFTFSTIRSMEKVLHQSKKTKSRF